LTRSFPPLAVSCAFCERPVSNSWSSQFVSARSVRLLAAVYGLVPLNPELLHASSTFIQILTGVQHRRKIVVLLDATIVVDLGVRLPLAPLFVVITMTPAEALDP
jgi:hypothetical protein